MRLPVKIAAMRCALALISMALASVASRADAQEHVDPWEHRGGYALMVESSIGDGLRFNNPFRLAVPLGRTAESVSRTAGYGELGIAAVRGDPIGLQHGLALRLGFAVEGIQQTVLTPSYVLWRRTTDWGIYARAGIPVVLSPDTTMGIEAAAGAVLFVRGGVGVAAEVVGDVFYGAGTHEVATPAYPVMSAQLGIVLAYEVLP